MGTINDLEFVEGLSLEEMIKEAVFDSVAKGICTNEGCEYTTEVEPDSSDGYCEMCGTNTVKSILVLMEMI